MTYCDIVLGDKKKMKGKMTGRRKGGEE